MNALENLEKMIIQNSRDLIWVIDSKQRFTFLSPALETMTGKKPEDLYGKSLDTLFSSDSLKMIDTTFKEKKEIYFKNIKENGLEQYKIDETIEADIISAKGLAIATETSLTINFDDNANINYVFGITRDISDRKNYEKTVYKIYDRFIKIVEKTPIGVFLFNQAGEIIFYNASFLEKLGYAHQEFYNESIFNITVPEDIALTKNYIKQIGNSVTETSCFRKRYLKKNGEILWVSENYVLFEEEDGKKIFLCLSEDINEHVKLEESKNTEK